MNGTQGVLILGDGALYLNGVSTLRCKDGLKHPSAHTVQISGHITWKCSHHVQKNCSLYKQINYLKSRIFSLSSYTYAIHIIERYKTGKLKSVVVSNINDKYIFLVYILRWNYNTAPLLPLHLSRPQSRPLGLCSPGKSLNQTYCNYILIEL